MTTEPTPDLRTAALARLLHEERTGCNYVNRLACDPETGKDPVHGEQAARLLVRGVATPSEPDGAQGDGPSIGPLTPKQVRILDNRHHRVKNSRMCACGQVWAHCEVHRLIETIAALRVSADSTAGLDAAEALRKLPCLYSGNYISDCHAAACEGDCDLSASGVLRIAATLSPSTPPETPDTSESR